MDGITFSTTLDTSDVTTLDVFVSDALLVTALVDVVLVLFCVVPSFSTFVPT